MAAVEVTGFPRQIVGHDRFVFGQAVVFDQLPHFLPAELHRRARSQRLIDAQSQLPTAQQEIQQVLCRERLVVDEHADGIESELLDASQIALDHFRVVRAPRPSQCSKYGPLSRPIPEDGM